MRALVELSFTSGLFGPIPKDRWGIAARSALLDTLNGDDAQAGGTLPQPLGLLVRLGLVPPGGGSEVLELEHDETGWLPVTFEDNDLAAANDESAAAGCDRSGRRCLVLLVLLRIGDLSLGNDVRRHVGNLGVESNPPARPTRRIEQAGQIWAAKDS